MAGTSFTYKDSAGVAQPIEPAPLVTTSKAFVKTPEGKNISTKYTIGIAGTLLPSRGSPMSTGAFGSNLPDEGITTDVLKFKSIEKKQKAIRELFSKDGQELLIQTSGGETVLKCYPTVASISFSEGLLVDKSQYSISLTANEISTDASDKDVGIDSEFWGANLKSASDTFSITKSEEDDDIYLLTRALTAVSSTVHASETLDDLGTVYTGLEPWQRAKAWVQQRIGPAGNYDILDDLKSAIENYTFAGLDIGGSAGQYRVFSKRDSENADRLNGSYTLSRTWTLSKNSVIALETYDVSISSDVPNQGGSEGTNFLRGFNTVYSLRGNVQGLESSGVSKYTNAIEYYGTQVLPTGSTASPATGVARWAKIIARINGGDTPMTSGITFTRPFSQSYSENKKNGALSYEFQFKEWSLANTFFADMSLNISENHDEQVIAAIPIPGRSKGPIIQNIGTTTLKVKNINGSFILFPSGSHTAGGLGLWKMSQIDEIRGEVISLLSNEPYNILETGQTSGWWVTSWNDSLDTLKGVYTTNMSITFKGTAGSRLLYKI